MASSGTATSMSPDCRTRIATAPVIVFFISRRISWFVKPLAYGIVTRTECLIYPSVVGSYASRMPFATSAHVGREFRSAFSAPWLRAFSRLFSIALSLPSIPLGVLDALDSLDAYITRSTIYISVDSHDREAPSSSRPFFTYLMSSAMSFSV